MGAIPAARLYHTKYRELPPPTPFQGSSAKHPRQVGVFIGGRHCDSWEMDE